jgi:predicted RNA-binding Zn-ribbon protein involved in translation (DUF1610 family)
MTIVFNCGDCGSRIQAPDNLARQQARCPTCQAVVTVPEKAFNAEEVPSRPASTRPTDFDFRSSTGQDDSSQIYSSEEASEDRRPCPMCGEMILMDAVKCRYCGEVLDPALQRGSAWGSGRTRQQEEAFKKAVNQASGILFGIAFLQVVCGAIALVALDKMMPGVDAAGLLVTLVVVAVTYTGLGIWARFQPFPAAIVGLVIYVCLLLLDFVAAPQMAWRGIILKIAFIAGLIQAISTASKAR